VSYSQILGGGLWRRAGGGCCGGGLDCPVAAIDVEDTFRCADIRVQFQRMDVRVMGFEDCAFDLVYSFHALEHIPEPVRALKEIARVLTDGGIHCIGTPNRSRIIGYIGSKSASLREKIQWNINDWAARLSGRFRNDLGAHAGFTAAELLSLCSVIGEGQNISDRYFCSSYGAFAAVLAAIRRLHLQAIVWPSVYVCGHKSISTETPRVLTVSPFAGQRMPERARYSKYAAQVEGVENKDATGDKWN
jgi:SAM-dependent methyltransferase